MGRAMSRGRIVTEYWAKPIPPREFDWQATRDDWEPGCSIGHGATEAEAIADLLAIEEEDQ
jgi:hypothetical protein